MRVMRQLRWPAGEQMRQRVYRVNVLVAVLVDVAVPRG
jgi:hypothetical protein